MTIDDELELLIESYKEVLRSLGLKTKKTTSGLMYCLLLQYITHRSELSISNRMHSIAASLNCPANFILRIFVPTLFVKDLRYRFTRPL